MMARPPREYMIKTTHSSITERTNDSSKSSCVSWCSISLLCCCYSLWLWSFGTISCVALYILTAHVIVGGKCRQWKIGNASCAASDHLLGTKIRSAYLVNTQRSAAYPFYPPFLLFPFRVDCYYAARYCTPHRFSIVQNSQILVDLDTICRTTRQQHLRATRC